MNFICILLDDLGWNDVGVHNEVANDFKKEDTFLQLSGYDIFYDK
jgi:hypothetical protein